MILIPNSKKPMGVGNEYSSAIVLNVSQANNRYPGRSIKNSEAGI